MSELFFPINPHNIHFFIIGLLLILLLVLCYRDPALRVKILPFVFCAIWWGGTVYLAARFNVWAGQHIFDVHAITNIIKIPYLKFLGWFYSSFLEGSPKPFQLAPFQVFDSDFSPEIDWSTMPDYDVVEKLKLLFSKKLDSNKEADSAESFDSIHFWD